MSPFYADFPLRLAVFEKPCLNLAALFNDDAQVCFAAQYRTGFESRVQFKGFIRLHFSRWFVYFSEAVLLMFFYKKQSKRALNPQRSGIK